MLTRGDLRWRGWDRALPVAFAVPVALLLVLGTIVEAVAHSDDNYWGYEWRSEDRGTAKQDYEFTEQAPGGANGDFADRVAEGAINWNQISINGTDMHFRRNGSTANYNPYADCADIPDFKNGIHYRTPSNPSASAETRPCTVFITNRYIQSFQVVLNEYDLWYKSDDLSNFDTDKNDTEGVSAHEFGHVVGGWGQWSDYHHYDNGVNPALCPDPATLAATHTMCKFGVPGRTWQRSLEEHDIDVFQLAYA